MGDLTFKDRFLPKLLRPREDEGEKGRLWEVCVIAAGMSLNDLDYPAEVLKESVHLFEGLPVFSYVFGDKAKERHVPEGARAIQPSGFAGNRVGQIVEAWWDEAAQEICALVAIDDEDTRTRLLNTYDRGGIGTGDAEKDAEGFSIDAEGVRTENTVTRIIRGNSLDLVTNPAAQGRVKRLVASVQEAGEAKMTTPTPTTATAPAATTNLPAAPTRVEEKIVLLQEQSPIDQIKFLADRLEGPQRGEVIEQLMKILAALRGDAAPATADVDQFAKMQAEVGGDIEKLLIVESIDDLRSGLKGLLSKVRGEAMQEEDERDVQLKEMATKLRNQSIRHALQGEDRFHCMETVRSLLDFNSFKVNDETGEVTGLKEALDGLAESKTFLLKPAATGAAGSTPGMIAATTKLVEEAKTKPGTKPATAPATPPAGQAVHLTESVSDDGTQTYSDRDLRRIYKGAEKGDSLALTAMGMLHKQGVDFSKFESE